MDNIEHGVQILDFEETSTEQTTDRIGWRRMIVGARVREKHAAKRPHEKGR